MKVGCVDVLRSALLSPFYYLSGHVTRRAPEAVNKVGLDVNVLSEKASRYKGGKYAGVYKPQPPSMKLASEGKVRR